MSIWLDIPQPDQTELKQKLKVDEAIKAIDPKLDLDKIIANLEMETDPETAELTQRLKEMGELAEKERQEAFTNLKLEVRSSLRESQKEILGTVIDLWVKEGISFDQIYKEYEPLIWERANLAHLLLGKLYAEMPQGDVNIAHKIDVWNKYKQYNSEFAAIGTNYEGVMNLAVQEAIENNIHVLTFADVEAMEKLYDGAIPFQTEGSRDLHALIREREKMHKKTWEEGGFAQEHNGVDQIIKAKTLIRRACLDTWGDADLAERLPAVVDPKLLNLLDAWANGKVDQIKPEDLPHLANLLKQNVKPSQIRMYEKDPLALRGQRKFLTAEAYHHAYESIAEEIYRSLDEKQRLLVDAEMGKINNPKDAIKYIADVRTDKERREATQIFKELAPKNLLKILAMIWGGSLATINLIASKGDVMSNEYFWIGAGVAGTAGMSLADRPLFGKDHEKMLAMERRSQHVYPFRGAVRIEGESNLPNQTLPDYMESNPDEVALLKSKMKKNNLSIAKLIKQSEVKTKVNQDEEGRGGERINLLTNKNFKNGSKEEVNPNSKAEIREGYERYLFLTSLNKLGIKTLADLELYQGVQEMNKKGQQKIETQMRIANRAEHYGNVGQIGEFMRSIAIVESRGSGDYSARWPLILSGRYRWERAMGKYQVMPGNLPQWSEEALGRAISEADFMANPNLQDTIVKYQMLKVFNKYWNWADVASVWHSGKPLSIAQNRSDGLTTTPQYVKKVVKNMKTKTV